jgi:ribonuclease E
MPDDSGTGEHTAAAPSSPGGQNTNTNTGGADGATGTPRSGNARRRGSRGGRNRRKPAGTGGASGAEGGTDSTPSADGVDGADDVVSAVAGPAPFVPKVPPPRPAAPKIGDSFMPPETSPAGGSSGAAASGGGSGQPKKRRRRGGRGRSKSGGGGGGGSTVTPVRAALSDAPIELDEEELAAHRGDERKGRPVGRYLMAVHVGADATQIAVLEGRALVEHYVSRPADDIYEIHGNIYLGKVQNVLPGMEAAFVDIGTPKNAVLYQGDVQYDTDDVEERGAQPRIEDVLKARQTILCQVTKNPIGHKGARLTQEISIPGRFVVLVPNSRTFGISKRLPDKERKRLRSVLDRAKPAEHGVIVRTAAENVSAEEIERDVKRLLGMWDQIDALAKKSQAPALLYREPEMAVRVIREEFSKDYRGIVIDDKALFDDIKEYVSSITPALADRLEYFDQSRESLPLFERHHVHEQLVKALDKKVWLPSGGSLIIERTEALTVIDVNTGKNVGKSSLEETVFRNNLEAASEIPRQLRLRDIGGIIVIDFVDMEEKRNRDEVMKTFRAALGHDKTRTQVFDISELGLVQMTRKRIGEGLIESLSHTCEVCEGRGLLFDEGVSP